MDADTPVVLEDGGLDGTVAAWREAEVKEEVVDASVDCPSLRCDCEAPVAGAGALLRGESEDRVGGAGVGGGGRNTSQRRESTVGAIKSDLSCVRVSQSTRAGGENPAAIVGLARKLNLRAIAEGVETEAQAEWLRNLGCDIGQGFFFARPMTAAAFSRYLDPTTAYAG